MGFADTGFLLRRLARLLPALDSLSSSRSFWCSLRGWPTTASSYFSWWPQLDVILTSPYSSWRASCTRPVPLRVYAAGELLVAWHRSYFGFTLSGPAACTFTRHQRTNQFAPLYPHSLSLHFCTLWARWIHLNGFHSSFGFREPFLHSIAFDFDGFGMLVMCLSLHGLAQVAILVLCSQLLTALPRQVCIPPILHSPRTLSPRTVNM